MHHITARIVYALDGFRGGTCASPRVTKMPSLRAGAAERAARSVSAPPRGTLRPHAPHAPPRTLRARPPAIQRSPPGDAARPRCCCGAASRKGVQCDGGGPRRFVFLGRTGEAAPGAAAGAWSGAPLPVRWFVRAQPPACFFLPFCSRRLLLAAPPLFAPAARSCALARLGLPALPTAGFVRGVPGACGAPRRQGRGPDFSGRLFGSGRLPLGAAALSHSETGVCFGSSG
jgi:hypothetical protein